ncbi:hypothetical protein CRENBAI_017812 [Crenichthys baileyi]|uniref:tRNA (34-2'-O)-methyltransferase regulator WDR6 n=1 Tax=Crenichthys baileyi TaxID=28760 RepID=A0AAV9SI87_9TELE
MKGGDCCPGSAYHRFGVVSGSASACRIHGIRPRSRDGVSTQSSTVTIHGQQEDEKHSTTERSFYDFAIFGGRAVRLTTNPCSALLSLALNGALLLDSTTGSALVQCSCLEGCLLYSALLLAHQSWTAAVLVGGTVFNQLIIWKPERGDGIIYFGHKAPVERRLLGHSGVIFSISYLQEKGYLDSALDDRSVRVWGVGAFGFPGGKCGDSNPICLRVLYGHQDRVFSVHLSTGYVFSTGEDDACLVWDPVGGRKVIRTPKGHRAGGVRSLAVSGGTGDDERWVATGGADGGVRLWMVEETHRN